VFLNSSTGLSKPMKVTISKAAEMAGVTRATLYRHIEKKGITVEKDEDDNPKIDVSELVRVYGDRLRHPEQIAQDRAGPVLANDTPLFKQAEQDHKIQAIRHETQRGAQDVRVELEILRERLRGMEEDRSQTREERARERDFLMEQIESLKQTLNQSQEQQKRLTALLTHQTQSAEEGGAPAAEDKLKELQETIALLRRQNLSIFKKLKQQEEARAKPFWKKLLG
jgi:chromosome segregation ATPase